MSSTSLVSNSAPLTVNVTLGNGQEVCIRIERNEAWFDEDGIVRILSIKFDDGSVCNMKLMPRSTIAREIQKHAARFLSIVGLSKVGGRLIGKGHPVISLGVYLASSFITIPAIDDLFESWPIAESAYYALDNGELVITQPIQLVRV